ncbi:MAG: hypothetical protein J7K81_10060, partial [Methanophagales archaeon]|nr:hypothetical protein [Methanophagales archaeon]
MSAANAPWKRNSFGRPCWDPRIVAICVFMKVSFCRTYDGIEAYLRSNDNGLERCGCQGIQTADPRFTSYSQG